MTALQVWLQNHNRKLTQDAIDEALMEYIAHVEKQRNELLAALELMNRAYVNLMENGRDRIIMLGGDCDPVEVMERGDLNLQESRTTIANVKGTES